MKAIIYTSNTGFTRKYAQMLSEKLSLPAYNAGLGEDKITLKSDDVIYGLISANKIEGLKKRPEDTISEPYVHAEFPKMQIVS